MKTFEDMLYHIEQEKRYTKNAERIIYEVCGESYFLADNWADMQCVSNIDGKKMFELRVRDSAANPCYPWRRLSSIFVPIDAFENPACPFVQDGLQEAKSKWYKMLAEKDEKLRKDEADRRKELAEAREKQKVEEENARYIQYLELKKQYEKQ